jgi:hypothetical protein
MRTLNLRLLFLIGVGGALLVAGGRAAHRFQLRRTARALLARVNEAEAAGHDDQARDELGRYLAFRPDDEAALERYARLLDRTATNLQDRDDDVLRYERVLLHGP